MKEWLDEFYGSATTRQALRSSLAPLYSKLGERIAAIAASEVGMDAFDVDSFLDSMVNRGVDGYLDSSKSQLTDLLNSPDPRKAIKQRIGEWANNRPSKVAEEETIRTANAVTQAVYRDSGITRKKWHSRGKSCPYCQKMNGRTVDIERPFHAAGTSLEVPDSAIAATKATMSFTHEIGHPPQHGGCDCVIQAELESRADLDEKRVKQWQLQPTPNLKKLLNRTNLHPTDRAEIHLALIRKTKKPNALLPSKPIGVKPAKPEKPAVRLGSIPPPPASGAVARQVSTGDVQRGTAEWAKSLWGNKSGPFYSSLPKVELDAAFNYSHSTFQRINRFLRKGSGGSQSLQRQIDALDSAIQRTAINRDIRVSRGTTLSAFNRYHPKTFIGQVISEPGYMSTSVKGSAASDFGGYAQSVNLKITAPQGTKALYMEPITSVKGEQEILFGRGTRMRVDRVVERNFRGRFGGADHIEYDVYVTIVGP